MTETLRWRDHPIKLTFSRRKSIAIHVHEGAIEIRAPKHTDVAYAKAFLQSKDAWLRKTLHAQQQRQKDRIDYSRANTIPFMGINVRLIRQQSERTNQWQLTQDGLLLTSSDFEDANLTFTLLSDFYQKQARFWLTKKTLEIAKQAQLEHKLTDIRLRKTKTKWGHCTAQGRIQYNWLIMMAPESVIDYLVCHEVSHLAVLNHSAAFWQQVEVLHSNYRADKLWLADNGHLLTLDSL
ncbi:M48 family metallopeptidase [Reinekea sp. G2M2-21]|uniref:M48 family metallopeptidase n=1 Tax=Reinekea sp. G2M2-21 TaxID=2788942 RepID=UPI0018ABC8EE|nr:SprT family zinc-dependent metalloprotease [Reinekea sp. G2M2-21]